MQIQVNFDACIGSGMCTTIAPSIFALDDDNTVVVLLQDSAEASHDVDAVRDAVACCPVEAIAVQPSEQ